MNVNLKIEHARRIMDKLHERNRKQGEDLKRLCALLTELTQDHAAACGALLGNEKFHAGDRQLQHSGGFQRDLRRGRLPVRPRVRGTI